MNWAIEVINAPKKIRDYVPNVYKIIGNTLGMLRVLQKGDIEYDYIKTKSS